MTDKGKTPRTDVATKPNFESIGVTVWDYEELRQGMIGLERELSATQAQIVALEAQRKADINRCYQLAKICERKRIRVAFPEDFQDE